MSTIVNSTHHFGYRRDRLIPMLFSGAVCVLISWGFWQRHDFVLSAETGLGYALGIVGMSCMILLLTYPLAKYQLALQRVMVLKHWFRLHMILGIVGPVAILFHCNFQLGSLNSSVALMCMLLVVGSGIIGRYFYSKVHLGLYGSKASSAELLELSRQQQQQLRQAFVDFPNLQIQIDALFEKLIPQDVSRASPMAAMLAAPRRAIHYYRIGVAVRSQQNPQLVTIWRDSRHTLKHYLATLKKLTQLRVFERLLSWWHILHLPIFFMMLITAVIHIWAVHRY